MSHLPRDQQLPFAHEPCGNFTSMRNFLVRVTGHPVVEPDPLRVAGIEIFISKFSSFSPPPRLGGETPQCPRPSAVGFLVAVGMQAGEGVGNRGPCAEEIGVGTRVSRKRLVLFVRSLHMWDKAIAVFVRDRAVSMHGYRDCVFFACHGVIEVSLSVQKLLNADHRVIGDFLLCVQLYFKYHEFVIAIAHNRNRNRTLEKCVDVNAKTVACPA